MGEVEPTPSCSHHSSSREIEYDCKQTESKDAGVETSDTSDEEATVQVQFKRKSTSAPLIIELGDREVIFAIVVFLLVSIALGLVLFLGTWKYEEDKVSNILYVFKFVKLPFNQFIFETNRYVVA